MRAKAMVNPGLAQEQLRMLPDSDGVMPLNQPPNRVKAISTFYEEV